MRAITVIYLYVALLPSIISGTHIIISSSPYNSITSGTHDNSYIIISSSPYDMPEVSSRPEHLNQARAKVDEIVTNGGNISEIFAPSKFLGRGAYCITYEGELLRNKKIVAMKFALSTQGDLKVEYEMYSYLNAIDNPTVENYGIPAVYYYGEWEGYEMMAITLLDSKFHELLHNVEFNWSDLDIFIMCREFVRISKYVHGRGVCQGDSHLGNLMFRGNKVFVIDFNKASKVGNGLESESRRVDWRKFLYNVCNLGGLDIDPYMCSNIVSKINELQNGGLKRVLLCFAYYVYEANRLDYDRMHDIITEEIHKQGVKEPALVSWLTDDQSNETLADWKVNRTIDIRDIADPYAEIRFEYSPPNYGYFGNNKPPMNVQ